MFTEEDKGEGEVKQIRIISEIINGVLNNKPIKYVDILLVFVNSFLIQNHPDEK